MSRHPVSLKIDEAIASLERHGLEVTVENVKANVRKALTWADFTSEDALNAVIDKFIPSRFRAGGHIIGNQATRARTRFWDAEVPELEEQLEIKRQSAMYDANRIKADEAVISFLKAKRDELSYEPYPGLFADEINRIYAMHGLATPGGDDE